MYKVFEIDLSFNPYEIDYVLVGGESVEDILQHFEEIFPSYEETVTREDWMTDEDWDDTTEYGKYKEGDVKIIPKFTDEQMQEFKKNDPKFPRIKEIENLFTGEPYTYLTGYSYFG